MVDVAAALVLLLGALVQAATGFGFALAAAPPLFVLLEPAAAVSALAVIGTQVNLMTLASERRRPVVMRAQAAGLVVAAVPGLWLGTIVLRWLPEDVLRVAVGLLVLGALALRSFGPRADVARSPARPWETAASGLASGMLNTSTGLSGPPLFRRSTAQLGRLFRLTGGRLPLVGVGGIASGADAYAKIRAGASALQLYTALVYQGPGVVPRVLAELDRLLAADGYASLGKAVGVDIRPALS